MQYDIYIDYSYNHHDNSYMKLFSFQRGAVSKF